MAKSATRYICQHCGSVQAKWMGRCPDCEEWNTLVETIVEPRGDKGVSRSFSSSQGEPQPLTAVVSDGSERLPLSIPEFDRVLGGGIVPGSAVLIGGDPGIGKSTLLLQAASQLGVAGRQVLYISGEESLRQIKMRAQRLGVTGDGILLLSETSLERMAGFIEKTEPALAVVDSIQSVFSERLDSAAGSVSQVRECAARLLQLAKSLGTPVFLVGHVTKAGDIAGPRVLEHIVDTVLYLEGERFHAFRLLRSVKNRFGSTNEVGVFEMTEAGLREVKNPSEAFLAERVPNTAGSAIAVTMEGTRPLLVEIQALTSTTSFGLPRRNANGVDMNRLLLLIAVLSKRAGMRLGDQDVFVNVVGGLRINEPAADLALAVAMASSYRGCPVPADLAVIGEIGLSGEIRSVGQIARRISEAARLGFRRCLVPRTVVSRGENSHLSPQGEMEIIPVRTLPQALEYALDSTNVPERQKL